MDYKGRISKLVKAMAEQDLDAVFLKMSSDLQYFTGVLRQPHNTTDDNKHGDAIYGALITRDGKVIFMVPRMGASDYVKGQSEGKPWINEIRVIDDGDNLVSFLSDTLSSIGIVRNLGVSKKIWYQGIELFRQAKSDLMITSVANIVEPMRAIKDKDEIALMKKAGEITDKIYGEVIKKIKVGMTEYDIEREIDYQMILHGASFNSFHTEVKVEGKATRRLKYTNGITGANAVVPKSVIAFDFGIIYQGYVSDFGRTLFVSEAEEKYVLYHDAVMKAQKLAIEAMKSNQITAAKLNSLARGVLDELEYGDYFTHRLGHGIGIDVHEPPFLYELDNTVLKKGMCFTVEPSIWVKNDVMVRVEDVVMVTESGGECFSKFSKDIIVI
jgi:Xaa-Pro aminopeptidase